MPGRENKSKLLAPDSDLYRCLQAIKTAIENRGWSPGPDKMDLHIEVAHQRNEPAVQTSVAELNLSRVSWSIRPTSTDTYGRAACCT